MKNTITRASESFLSKVRSDEGSIEPALVLIPLMVLVLSILQLASGVLMRGQATFQSQSGLYWSALAPSDFASSDLASRDSNFANYGSSDSSSMSFSDGGAAQKMRVQAIPSSAQLSASALDGGGTYLVGRQKFRAPSITPLLPNGDEFEVNSIVIAERP